MALTTRTSKAATLMFEALDHLGQGMVLFDDALRLVAWNKRFADLLGDVPLRKGAGFASVGWSMAQAGLLGEGTAEQRVEDELDRLRRCRSYRTTRRIADAAIEVVGTPLPDGGFVTTFTDVTDRLRQQETLERMVGERTRDLRLAEERLALVANEVPAGIAHLDAAMTFLYANRRFANAYGLTPAQVVGLSAYDLLSGRTMEDSARFFDQARRGVQVDFEMRIDLPDGRSKDVRTLLRPDRQTRGKVTGFYLVSVDVTRTKATAAALMRSQKMDALGRMASGISHDFNNLLTVVLGNLVPLAERLGDDPVNAEYVAPSIAAARRGSDLTRRLLTLARREQVDPRPTDIDETIADICRLLQATLPETLTLDHSGTEDLPAAMVDQAQLEMAVLNLVMNARAATGDAGRITISTDLSEITPDEAETHRIPAGAYLRLRVTDDGCGMSPEQAERIFEPFYTTKTGTGSGLGLSMVYGFVRQSNGAIWVDTAEGQGATFTLLLPLAGSAVAAPQAGADTPPPLTGLVLLVEDDTDVRRTIRRKIASASLPVIEAGSADEALDLARQIPDITAVLSDVDMPGTMDGFDLAHRLSYERPDLRVVLMSGKAAPDDSHPLPAGTGFLRKPFTAEEALDALARATPEETKCRT